MSGRLLVVAGMKREIALVRDASVVSLCSGGNIDHLERLLARFDPAGLSGVVSFGLAGGLDPALRPGDLVAAHTIVAPLRPPLQCIEQSRPTRSWSTDPVLTEAILRALTAEGLVWSNGCFAGVDEAIMTPDAKAGLQAASGACAVDMESHVAARYAAVCGLPFAALRAICDPAARALPAIAARALTPEGGVNYPALVAGLARAPGDLGALIAAGKDSSAGFATLARAGRVLAGFMRAERA
ncbi:MAG: phosphorylase [Rhodoblastus sp.]